MSSGSTVPSPPPEGALAPSLTAADPRALQLTFTVSGYLAMAGIVVGLVVLLGGWVIGIEWIKGLLPGMATMKPATAICIALVGAGLWLERRDTDRAHRWAAGVGILSIAVSLLTVSAYLVDAGAPLLAARLMPPPQRMSLATSVGLLLLGIAVVLLRWARFRTRPADFVALGAILVGLVGIEGYLFGTVGLYRFLPYGSMALHTAALIFLLGLGVLTVRPERGVLAPFVSRYDGGKTARLVLPTVVTAILLVAWLRLQGERAGWYGTEVGLAIFSSANIVLITTVTWMAASRVNRADLERRDAEVRALADVERLRLLSAVVESSDDAILTKSTDGTIQSWNRSAELLYGYRPEEAIGQNIALIVPADRRAELADLIGRVQRGESVHHLETVRQTRDGRRIDVSLSLSPVTLGPGRSTGIAAIARDITDRRRQAERLQAVVESAPNGMMMVTEDGRIELVNRAAEVLFGYRRKEMLGQTVDMLLPEKARARHPAFRADFGRDPTPRAMGAGRELFARRKDGSEVPVEIGLNPIEIDQARYVLASIVDVSARKLADERTRLVVEASPSGLVVVDPAGIITMVNQEMVRMFDWPREQLVGQPIDRLLPEQARPSHDGLRRAYMEAPGRRAMGVGRELFGRRRDGTEFPVEIGLNPLRQGNEVAVLAVVTDITERRAAEQALARHQRELERSNKELAHFAYVASHDLQEPLRMVSSYAELFSERYQFTLDERGSKYLGYMVDGARRMQALVRDLLAYARVDSQGRPLEATGVARVLTATLHDLSGAITEAEGTIEHGEMPTVWADPVQLQQLLQNLIGNAVKFRSGMPPRVRLTVERQGPMLAFAVSDNGIGIAPEFAERVFGMFQRLHTREEFAGSGIGLSIARKIVERHEGRIWVDTTVNGGTTIRFTLWPADGPRPPGTPGSAP